MNQNLNSQDNIIVLATTNTQKLKEFKIAKIFENSHCVFHLNGCEVGNNSVDDCIASCVVNNFCKKYDNRKNQNKIHIKTLKDFNINDLPEDGDTLVSNALQKAEKCFELTNCASISDDTGFFIHGLDGYPGVYAARVAGENGDFYKVFIDIYERLSLDKNKQLLEKNNKDAIHCNKDLIHKCHFATAIAYVSSDMKVVVEEKLDGYFYLDINNLEKYHYEKGYNSVFFPVGFDKSFRGLGEENYVGILPRVVALRKVIKLLKIFD